MYMYIFKKKKKMLWQTKEGGGPVHQNGANGSPCVVCDFVK